MATTRTSSAGKVSFGSWESEEREHPQGCSFFCALSSAAALLGLRAHRARGFCSPKGLLLSLHRAGGESKGAFSFAKENAPFGTPRERLRLAVSGLNNSDVSEVKVPRARRSRVSIARRFASAPTIRCCAAVGGSDALRMRHTPCGCRSAHLVEVRSNFRLPPVSTMRRAQQCRYFARSLPPSNRHSRLTTVRRG